MCAREQGKFLPSSVRAGRSQKNGTAYQGRSDVSQESLSDELDELTKGTRWVSLRSCEILDIMSTAAVPVLYSRVSNL